MHNYIYDFKAVEFSKTACAFQDDEVEHIFFPYFSVLAALRADASFLQYRQSIYGGCSSVDGTQKCLCRFHLIK